MAYGRHDQEDTFAGAVAISPWVEGPAWPKAKEVKESQRVKVEDLDLDRSYLNEYIALPSMENENRPRQTRWRHSGPNPLTDPAKLPKGWNTKEPDLDENDFDAQIARCLERIEDNIMPAVFEQRLIQYRSMKEKYEKQWDGEDKNHSWEVIQRINSLKSLRANLKNGDPNGEMINVKALLKAYRKGNLLWNSGLVTYWSKGRQLCQPRRFDWDEFEAIGDKYEYRKAMWVEGICLDS
ncbi:hypothetical protein N7492_008085, partial [Penicillium capsulatum]